LSAAPAPPAVAGRACHGRRDGAVEERPDGGAAGVGVGAGRPPTAPGAGGPPAHRHGGVDGSPVVGEPVTERPAWPWTGRVQHPVHPPRRLSERRL